MKIMNILVALKDKLLSVYILCW